jgi:hypothetical protein
MQRFIEKCGRGSGMIPMQYYWRGELIQDIDKFCEKHKTKMVKVKHTKEILFRDKIIKCSEIIEMPELFWQSFGWNAKDGMYEVVG